MASAATARASTTSLISATVHECAVSRDADASDSMIMSRDRDRIRWLGAHERRDRIAIRAGCLAISRAGAASEPSASARKPLAGARGRQMAASRGMRLHLIVRTRHRLCVLRHQARLDRHFERLLALRPGSNGVDAAASAPSSAASASRSTASALRLPASTVGASPSACSSLLSPCAGLRPLAARSNHRSRADGAYGVPATRSVAAISREGLDGNSKQVHLVGSPTSLTRSVIPAAIDWV